MNEDFVSFDLAKKLKEKGFDMACIYAYCEKGGWNIYTQKHEPITYILRTDGNPFGSYYTGDNWNKEYKPNKNKIRCSAPTISQVLKWLRDKNAIFVHISIYSKGWYCDVYTYEYYEEDREYSAKHIVQLDEFSTYEEAAIAGITYCLDNLI